MTEIERFSLGLGYEVVLSADNALPNPLEVYELLDAGHTFMVASNGGGGLYADPEVYDILKQARRLGPRTTLFEAMMDSIKGASEQWLRNNTPQYMDLSSLLGECEGDELGWGFVPTNTGFLYAVADHMGCKRSYVWRDGSVYREVDAAVLDKFRDVYGLARNYLFADTRTDDEKQHFIAAVHRSTFEREWGDAERFDTLLDEFGEWVSGNCHQWTLVAPFGDVLDSCGGYINDYYYCKSQGLEAGIEIMKGKYSGLMRSAAEKSNGNAIKRYTTLQSVSTFAPACPLPTPLEDK